MKFLFLKLRFVSSAILYWYDTLETSGHYSDVITSAIVSQTTGVSIVYSTVCWSANQRKISKLRVTGLCEGNSPITGKFPSQRASNVENVSIWRRHRDLANYGIVTPYGDIDLGHHWLWWWLGAITRTMLTYYQLGAVTVIWKQFHKRYLSHQLLKKKLCSISLILPDINDNMI